ncbi:MAG TPA: choice-of-anchor D domain-containing protein, partial [Steroidobacteraceae bacterium]|nr:choice-of-anchor D domain-containing protein [Steroidobacteraceae bacterium]
RFNPNLIGTQFGALILQTGNARDSVVLSGIGRPGSRGYKLSQPNITSTMCDSAEGTLVLRNISCTQVTISSIGIAPPFRFDPVATPVTMATDSAIVLKYHFVPNTPGMYNAAVTINSLNVNDVFDTSLTLVGVATEGTANISYSPPALNFDSVSVCSLREFDISIASTGCDTLAIPLDTLTTDTTEFHIVSDVSSRAVLRGDTVHIKVRFHPPGVGSFSSVLHIQTNTGPINIPMQGIGSSDPGVLSLSGVTLGNILTCKDTTFSFTIENTTCDSLVLDSIRVTGIGRSDYVTTYTAPTPLGLGAKNTFTTHFIPQAGGNRNAILHCYLHKTDGTLVEKNTPLNGVGVAPVPIRLSLPSITYSTLAGAPIQIPVTVLDTSYIDVGTTTFSLSLNTDLLTPTNFDLTGSIFGGASVIGFNVVKTGVTISLSVPPGERFHSGLLGTLDCIPFVSDTITTDIIESTFTAFDKDTSANCLPTALITPPQTITSFTLAPACGISTLTKYLRYGPSGIFIQSISPNPAHSEIIFSALLDPIPDGDLAIDILDDAGALVQSEHIPHSELRSPFVHTMNILGASGTRTLRLQSGASETLGRFVLVK